MLDRRRFALSAAGVAGALLVGGCMRREGNDDTAEDSLRAIEQASGGRLGVAVVDTGSGRGFGWRGDERFCLCSTFKTSLAAMALREADAGRIDLDAMLPFTRSDLVEYAPVVEAALAAGQLSVATLAEAGQVTSDNAAANILMRRLGGPAALTRFWRETGDPVSRLDAYEPDLNVIPPGTEENSTTPAAMAATLQRIVLGDVLTPASRARLTGWMDKTMTGTRRIRAGLPAGWRAIDKTGSGMRRGIGNKTNDIAVLYPPSGAPLIVSAFFEHPRFSESVRPEDEAVHRRVGALAAEWQGGRS